MFFSCLYNYDVIKIYTCKCINYWWFPQRIDENRLSECFQLHGKRPDPVLSKWENSFVTPVPLAFGSATQAILYYSLLTSRSSPELVFNKEILLVHWDAAYTLILWLHNLNPSWTCGTWMVAQLQENQTLSVKILPLNVFLFVGESWEKWRSRWGLNLEWRYRQQVGLPLH